MFNKIIYLDNHATTKIHPKVFKKMCEYSKRKYGNASEISHLYGIEAKQAVEVAREHVAALIGAKPHQIFFTSGATESNNIILNNFDRPVVSSIEHSSIYNFPKTIKLPVMKITGDLDLSKLEKIKPGRLISVMGANNEIGTINPLVKIGDICFENKLIFHTDLSQCIGKLEIDLSSMHVDYASISAHKFHGPKGIGALYIRDNPFSLKPLMYGGNQEFGLSPGTLNVPAIVGFGEAARIAKKEFKQDCLRISNLQTIILNELSKDKSILIHNSNNKLCNNIHFTLTELKDPEKFVYEIADKVAISAGSACLNSSGKYSHVLENIGYSEYEIKRSFRIGLSKFNTKREVKKALKIILKAYEEGK